MNSYKCRVCGKYRPKDASGLCLNCKILKNEYLKVTIDYIHKRSCTSAEQIKHLTGIDKEYILYFEEQGLISLNAPSLSPSPYADNLTEELIKINHKAENKQKLNVSSAIESSKQASG